MFSKKLITQIKQHPFATAICALYLVFWSTVYFLLFIVGAKVGDLALQAMFLSIPYSLTTLFMSILIKRNGRFFLWLTYLIYIPIIVTMMIILPLL
jgi:hypothetical protein